MFNLKAGDTLLYHPGWIRLRSWLAMGWTRERAAEFTRDIPHRPGVYIMRDLRGRIVYIGKARDLHSRVIQYFRESGDPRPFVRLLSEVLGRLETVVTATEKEALILENELIKKHRPPFNVMLKDDKAFLYLKVNIGEDFPGVELSRRRRLDGALYFGPSHSAAAIRQTHLLVNRHFGLRTCRTSRFKNRTRPCLEWQMGRCAGPCCGKVTKDGYRERVEAAVMFLKGRYQEVVRGLTAGMKAAAGREDFEEAARLRDQIRAVEDALSRQAVVLPGTMDTDVVGYARSGDVAVFTILRFESGVLQDRIPLVLEDIVMPDEDLVESVLVQYYSRAPVPADVFVPAALTDMLEKISGENAWSALEEVVGTRGRRQVRITTARRGAVADALKMAAENSAETLKTAVTGADSRERALQALSSILGLTRPPSRIEGFDMSTFQAAEPVGSMVVMTDGRPDRRAYRTFAVKWSESVGDTGFMKEVLTRRLSRVAEGGEWAAPDLIMLDGGQTQLSVAVEVMRSLNLDIPLVALAKSRVTAAPAGPDQHPGIVSHTPERLFVPGQGYSPVTAVREPRRAWAETEGGDAMMIVPNQNDPGLHLLMRLRDEAHRFAISYHRKLRDRRGTASVLDGIPGLGKKRRTDLLRHFRTVAAIRNATLEELTAAPGIPAAVAERIFERLHGAG